MPNLPQDLNFALYFNIAFFSSLGLGFLFGFLRGMKKAMWGFIVTLIFIAVFFLTIDQVINLLWTINMPFLGGLLANVSPSLSGVTQLQQALPILLNEYLGDTLNAAVNNQHLLEFLTSLSLFILKIVYTILYFTVIQILYRLILWIVRMIVTPKKRKTDKYKSKNRVFGGVFGLLQGALTLYLTIIIFGGVINITESLVSVMPEQDPTAQASIELNVNQTFSSPTDNIITTYGAINLPIPDQSYEESLGFINDMIDGYNTNPIVIAQNKVTMTSEYSGNEIPLNLYLFDSVLSMNYQDEQIAIREELGTFADVAGQVISNPYFETNNLSDIEPADITSIFTTLGNSNLLTSILPLGVDVASDMFDVPIDIPTEDLYDPEVIDWATEFTNIGTIAANAFLIINSAGILNDNVDLQTVQLDGTQVEELFDSLGDSQLINLALDVAIDPLLDMAGDSVSTFITVPDDINWADEFAAIGDLSKAVLDTQLTMADISDQDIPAILTAVSDVDFNVLLESQLITNALINILSGNTTINVDFLNVPTDIVWLDTVVDGTPINGELHNILNAVNTLTNTLSTIDIEDFTNLSLSTIADLDLTTINSIFESRILVATITNYLSELDFGDYAVVVPDSVFDEDGYLLKTELQKIVTAVSMVLDNLTCDPGDTTCEALGFDFNKITTLTSDNIDTLLAPDILAATVGNVLIELGSDVLTIPGSALTQISVDDVATDVVSRTEIENAFLAISTLGITDINNISVDISILQNLATEADPTVLDQTKADTLFGSSIINATLSQYLIDFSEQENAIVVVPYWSQSDDVIRETDAVDGTTEYISQDELTNILQAVLVLDLQDFNSLDSLDLTSILDNIAILLDSSILHATVSKQLLDLSDVVTVPLNKQNGDPLQITTGPAGHLTTYIDKTELENAIDALQVLGITDINNVSIDVSILNNLGTTADPTVLDQAKADQLFSSSIINATLSSYIIDFATQDDPFIVVPYKTELGVDVRTVDSSDGTEYISQDELTNILTAILVLDIQDFNSIETFSLDTIINNISTLLDSSILHATVSKQLLDLTDVVTIPQNDQFGNPLKITRTGLDGNDYTYIARTELEATIDALEVLGMTDINNITIDVSILNNLGTTADPTILDQTKADTLFGSSIINATLSNYMIDFTTGTDPFIVVPFKDQEDNDIRTVDAADGTEYIAQSELTNLLKAILILNLQDFDSVETLDLGTLISNASTLLDSAILHATISKQFINLGSDIVTIPQNNIDGDPLKITRGTGAEEVTYIDRDELIATFDSLDVLGITDINGISVDVSILNNLAIDSDPTVLDQTKADRLFASSIITATLSSYLADFSDAADPLIIVPYKDENDNVIRTVDPADGTQYITQSELTNILKTILVLQLNNFDSVDTLSLTSIIDNKSTILDSAIMQATISKQLLDLGSDIITIPYKSEADTFVRKTVGDPGKETELIVRAEIEALLDSLDVMGIGGIGDFSGTIDLQSIIADSAKVDTLLASSTIQATMSKQLLDLTGGTGALVIVPYRDETNLVNIRLTRGDVGEETEYITVNELKAIFDSLDVLGIYDVSNFGGTFDLSLLDSPAKVATLVASATIQATITKQVTDLTSDTGGSTTVIVPYQTDEAVPTDLRVDVGPVGFETELIIKSELEDLVNAFLALGFTGVGDMTGAINISALADNASTVFASYIVQATVSKQIIDLADAGTVVAPYFKDDNSTRIRKTVNTTEYISKDELESMVIAMDLLTTGSVTDFTGTIDVSLFYDAGTRNTLLTSSIFQATVSKQITDLGGAITVPQKADDTTTDVRFLVGSGAEQTEFISKPEIGALFEVLELWGMDDISDFDGTIQLDLFLPSQTASYDTNQDILLNSASIQATISKQITDLNGSNLVVPTTDILNQSIQVSTSGTTFIYVSEIKHLINAMDLLGVTNIATFDGTISLANLFETTSLDYDTNQDTMLSSAIMHATLSKQILDMDGSSLTIPALDASGGTIKTTVSTNDYLVKTEIKSLLNALDTLGAPSTGVGSFDGTINIDALSDSNDQDKIMLSATMHATISKKIIDINTNPLDPVLIFPKYDVRISPTAEIYIEHVDVDFIEKAELKLLLDALNEMGLTSFGSVSITPALVLGNDNTIVTASAIMQATISDKILSTSTDENSATSGTLIVPAYFHEAITVNGAGATWIEQSELILLMDSLDTLGVTSFDGGVDGSALNTMSDAEITTLVASGSMHTTVDYMLNDNSNLSGSIPNIAQDTYVYVSYDLITQLELKYFILATQVIAGPGDSITNINLDASSINGLTAGEQSTMLDSAIVRCKITPDLETASAASVAANFPNPGYTFDPSDYESGSIPATLTKVAAQDAIDNLGPYL